MSVGHLPHALVLAPLLVLYGLIVLHLRAAGLGSYQSALLGGVSLAQPGYLIEKSALSIALFALAALAVGITTLAFAKRQDPRRTVMLGGSLAGAQIAHPLWGTAAIIMLPLALRRSMGIGAERSAGLYVSLLFIPAITTIVLVYLMATGSFALQAATAFRSPPKLNLFSIAITLSSGAAFLLACLIIRKSRSTLVMGGISVLLASIVLQVVGAGTQLLPCAAAVSVFLLLLLTPSSKNGVRFRTAIGACVVNAALCWGLALVAAGLERVQ